MRSTWVLTVLLISCLIGGCVRTIQPILEDNQVIVDNSIAGKWVDKEGKSSVEVDQADSDKICKVLYTDEDGKKGVFRVRIGKIGDILIAEVTPDDSAPGASDVYKAHLLPLHSFLVIRQTKPQLLADTMGQAWLKKYLEQHPNELQVTPTDKDSLVITSSTVDIQAFLQRHFKEEDALDVHAVLVRPGDPTTRPAATEPAK